MQRDTLLISSSISVNRTSSVDDVAKVTTTVSLSSVVYFFLVAIIEIGFFHSCVAFVRELEEKKKKKMIDRACEKFAEGIRMLRQWRVVSELIVVILMSKHTICTVCSIIFVWFYDRTAKVF